LETLGQLLGGAHSGGTGSPVEDGQKKSLHMHNFKQQNWPSVVATPHTNPDWQCGSLPP
jgi:hypothetical protein